MHTGQLADNRSYSSLTQHQPSIRIALPGATSASSPAYAQSQQSIRHPTGSSLKKEAVHLPYKSASPDFADIVQHHNHTSYGNYRADTSYTPRYYRGTRMRTGFPMAAFYGAGSDMHIFTQVRSKSLTGRKHSQQLPQLSVVPAPKHSRTMQQQQQQQQRKSTFVDQPGHHQHVPKPVVVKRVEVSLHEVQQTGRLAARTPSPTQERENNPVQAKGAVTLPPKLNFRGGKRTIPSLPSPKDVPLNPVDLNKGLNDAAAIRKRDLVAKGRGGVPLEEALAAKMDVQVVSLNHLPLKEVYLKPDPTSGREQASRQQQDKTIRILNWLKNLNYLDEKAVQRGRTEVERTQFQLPEIKDTALFA